MSDPYRGKISNKDFPKPSVNIFFLKNFLFSEHRFAFPLTASVKEEPATVLSEFRDASVFLKKSRTFHESPRDFVSRCYT
ncbi:MAG: hypothetical protein IAE82_01555 [Opitutaceae bacterium]|nr:hypothetical protein [Opitutaceae bacterium]